MPKRLSKRLEAIASFVPNGSFLADVGSDHAYLPIALVERGVIDYAQAIDDKMGPFMRMKGNVTDHKLENRIILSRSDGISALRSDVDCVAICGLGGLLSCSILESHPERLTNVKTIVMDPHRDLRAVRARVSALGFAIVDETMVYEDKIYYSIIRFDRSENVPVYTEDELCFGPILMKKKEPLFLDWLYEQRKRVNSLLDGPTLPKARREYCLRLYRSLTKLLKEGGRL